MLECEISSEAQWGRKLIPTLNSIFKTLCEKIDSGNTNINAKFDEINNNIKTIKDDLIAKIENAQRTADTALKTANESRKLAENVKEEMCKVQFDYENLKFENIRLQHRANHLDNYSRRDNLVISGIEETENEICEQKSRDFFKIKLKMESDKVDEMRIVRCHRLGRNTHPNQQQSKPRPIIVRFYNFSEQQDVWNRRQNLNDKTFSMNENFCADTDFKRRKLYPIYREAKKMDKYRSSVSLHEDTLLINSRSYNVDTLADLPIDLHPNNMCEKSDEKCLVFGGLYSEFSTHSNWFKSSFTFKEKRFVCLEQGYMYNKAVINGAPETARQISYMCNPRDIKRIGSAITVKDQAHWNNVKEKLMIELVREKYTQNPTLLQELLDTGNRALGETGRDPFYSIGLPLTHPDVLNSKKWKSGNKLGKALQTIRRELGGL